MTSEPVLALAPTPRDWAQRLHSHVADHGGARIRATVLTAGEALDEQYDVLLADDRTSFLSQRLVRTLHERGRLVIGLFDPGDPQGKSDLVDYGVDESVPSDLSPGELVATAQALSGARLQTSAAPADTPGGPGGGGPGAHRRSHLVTITGARGAGRTEVALSLAAVLVADGEEVVLAEVDEAHASLAPRLGLPPWPNLRAALDWSRESARASAAVQRIDSGFGVLVAGPLPQTLGAPPPDDLSMVVDELAATADWLVLDLGDRPTWLSAGHSSAVVVGEATPVGAVRLQRLLERQSTPFHLVVNHAPPSAYRRWEFLDHVTRTWQPRSLVTVPDDRVVYDAAWRGQAATQGSFGKAMRRLAAAVRADREEQR